METAITSAHIHDGDVHTHTHTPQVRVGWWFFNQHCKLHSEFQLTKRVRVTPE